MTARLPLVVGYANEVGDEGQALPRALEVAREIAALPQGAIRTDKETMVRNVGRTHEERLRNEVEAALSMFWRRDSHAIGAAAFKRGETPERPHHGL
jgi:enoyl-CoA hydratase